MSGEAGLATTPRLPYTLSTLVKLGRRRTWQIMLPAIAIAGAASWWIHQLPNRYRSDALLLVVSQRVPETFVRSTVTTRSENRLQSITQQILSRTHLEQIIRDFDLYSDQRNAAVMEDIVESMRSRDIQVQPVKGDAFRLGFIADSPEVAMRVVDRLASLFIGQTSLDRATLAEGTDHFLEQQLTDIRSRLVDNEAKLGDYRRRHNGELPKQLDANVQGLHSTEMQIQTLAESLNRDRDRQLVLERSLKDVKLTELVEAGGATPARASSADTAAPSVADQLRRAEAALKDMQSTLTEQHPDVVALKRTIGDLRKRAEAETASRVASADVSAADQLRRSRLDELRTDLSAVEQQITQKETEQERLHNLLSIYQNRIEAEPTREAELAALTRDYDTLQETYRGLLTKKQESEISANLERQQIDAQFKVLDPARLPERPFAPNRPRLYAAGALGGLGIGLLFAGILEWFDRSLRTENDVRAALRVPVLAAIPPVLTRRFESPRNCHG